MNDDDDDDGMALFARKFKGLLKNKVVAKRGEKKKEKPQCYEYKGFSHMKNKCPNKENEEENEKKKEKE